ncbi:MAG: sulfotransferase [Mariprofundaceae bacterium]|nr:sulfotransferase [Mariprofundaceae bacterium]
MSDNLPISNTKKRKIDALLQQGNLAFAQSKMASCEKICKKIDRIIDGLPHVWNLRGTMAASLGKLDRAEDCFSQALKVAPNQVEFLENLARVYALKGQPRKASDLYEKTIRFQHTNKLNTVLSYCTIMIEELQEADKAVDVLLPLLKKHPEEIRLLAMLATAYFNGDKFEQCEVYLQQLLSLDPNHSVGNRQMGLLQSQQGNITQAQDYFHHALATPTPNDSVTYANLVLVKKYRDPNDDDILQMKRIEQSTINDSITQENVCFALGKVYNDLKDTEQAFSYFRRGNALRRTRSSYQHEQEVVHIQQIMDAYTPALFDNNSALTSTMPFFITGMPRCGTTLIEQILASHPDVQSKGECDIMENVALARRHCDAAPLTLERITHFTKHEWQQVGQDYRDAVSDNTNTAHITDKTLGNIRLIGAIHCALPHAKIIHVRRHPLDTCWSIFKNNLAGELLGFGSSLTDLGQYYRMYQQLMAHWRNVLPEGVMYEVNYEDIVRNQEAETRRLLAFCDLEWDDHCLQFHTLRNQVKTASVAQVRRPIYKDSVAAWKPYEKHLQALIDIIGTKGWDE